ncbi:hypothetical protein B0H13DRAFT_1112925 [Mycena leptocephala]|nr:hypothetical protein B0H13DRAFT_1112925 [Mycena leptocephala]
MYGCLSSVLTHPSLSTLFCCLMSNNGDEMAGVLQLIEDSRLTGYLAVASLCVLIYDHALCFAAEVDLIWRSHSGLAKTIYLWNRYFSLISISLVTSAMVREITADNLYG